MGRRRRRRRRGGGGGGGGGEGGGREGGGGGLFGVIMTNTEIVHIFHIISLLNWMQRNQRDEPF